MFKQIMPLSMMFFSLWAASGILFTDAGTAASDDKEKEEREEQEVLDFDELPEEIHPEVEEKAETLVEKAKEEDIDIKITDDFRSIKEQDGLFNKGRTFPGQIVTNAKGGESYHNYGLAIDYALEVDGKVIWDVGYDGNDNGASDWFEVADIAKDLGFEWGGDWDGFKDYPHLEMNFDYSIRELQKEYRDLP
ncbi:M15 family metallopeptidase [Salinicoccus bachuensis]|uniref:M15 family metallopeptidase n=1 Tax=Salinicoccus bachuensis TaxID=3136731 RepID=A0ABZ3CLV1_9STAP